MNDFNTLFPNFLNQCTQLNGAMMPVACVLFVIGVVSSTVSGHRSASAYLRTVGRTCGYIAVLASLMTWGNVAATGIDYTVKNTLQADPGGVYSQYQTALTLQKGTTGQSQSWWDLLDSQSIFEGLLSCVLWVLGCRRGDCLWGGLRCRLWISRGNRWRSRRHCHGRRFHAGRSRRILGDRQFLFADGLAPFVAWAPTGSRYFTRTAPKRLRRRPHR